MNWIVLGAIILVVLVAYFVADVYKETRRIKHKVEQGIKSQKKTKKKGKRG